MQLRTGMLLGVVGLGLSAGVASADVSLNIFEITAQQVDDNGVAIPGAVLTHTYFRPAGSLDPTATHTWNLDPTLDDNGTPTDPNDDWGFGGGEVSIHQDPVVNLTINAAAGNSNTVFTINSALVSFSTIGNLQARASTSLNFTDSALFAPVGSVNIASGFGSGNAFEARINGAAWMGLLPVGSYSVPGGSASFFQETSVGLIPVAGTAVNISTHFKFTLSPRDRVSGTSTFEIIPTPGSLGLLAGAGLIALRRRR